MALIEIMSTAFNQYRSGIVYAIQYGDYDAAVVFLRGMTAMLPIVSRPHLPDIPQPSNLAQDLQDKAVKWQWVVEANFLVEEAISKWIHTNLARMNM